MFIELFTELSLTLKHVNAQVRPVLAHRTLEALRNLINNFNLTQTLRHATKVS